MFKIKGQEIHLTRGDIALIEISAKTDEGSDYTFQIDDVVRFKVFRRKDCSIVEMQKDVIVKEPSTKVDISLTSDDTRIGELIAKPTKYWYEVEVNPDTNPQTIIGYDEDGAKELILYPEGDNND